MNEEQLSRFHRCINDKRFNAAFDICTEAIRDDKDDWNAVYLAGISLRFQGDSIGAISYYQRALSLNPNSAPIWQALGVALQSLRRFTEAIEALSTAISIDSNSYASHNSLGLTFALAGNYNASMQAYENALQVCANRAIAEVRHDHPELFRIEQQGDSRVLHIDPSYSAYMQQILATDFNYFNTLKNMVMNCVEMGDHDRARDLQEHIDNCTPIDADIIGPIHLKSQQ
jgi:tetratricopeptide (TPR) repeat protein